MEKRDPLELAQLIVRGSYHNFGKRTFAETTSVYRFSNENITAYFHHLENKEKVLTVIGSGGQILNSILAGTQYFDCFDISIFPEYYLHLQIASVLSLSKEDYLKYYFSEDREELFGDDLYDKISPKLSGKYKQFWDTLYMFDDGFDIYNSLLFRQDTCLKRFVLNENPYLQDNNYEKLKHLLQTESIKINPTVADIMKTRFPEEYDLINLSNILSYHFAEDQLQGYIKFLQNNFSLTNQGEIINYHFGLSPFVVEQLKKIQKFQNPNVYIESIDNRKLLVYKK